MTIQIAIIDPFIKTPAIHCFNDLVALTKRPSSYHQPASLGIESLIKHRKQNMAYVILGSASHVHENLPWQGDLARFLLDELHANKPVLGCCFGHQLMCHALGSQVEYFSADEEKLSGLRAVTITEDFWNFKQGESFTLGVTHRQVVKKLGAGLKEVGLGLTNDLVIHQKLPFLGVQPHPEASDFFCRSDIGNVSASEQSLLQKDGKSLISRFFQHFNLM
jgi:GMP synthase-like glutamine amidotransferase